jgi:hypothetical protein
MEPKRNLLVGSVVGLAWCAFSAGAWSQTFERDTTITGPRGRTIQRQVEIQRSPGMIDRQIQIKRPGGTFERQVQIQRTPAGSPWRPAWGGPGPRPLWFPRPAVIGPAGPAFGLGLGFLAVPSFNFAFGGGGLVPPPVVGPVPPPGVPLAGPPGGPPQPPDQVVLEAQRLQSFHANTRKDAAYKLGRLGDPRAVPSLIHVLKYDSWKDVRIAAAIALGEIGGSEAAVALERCAIYDHKDDVKKAATTALERLNAKAKAGAPVASRAVMMPARMPAAPSPSPFAGYPVSNRKPAADMPEASPASPPQEDATPPPPPTPVTPRAGGAGNP